MKSILFFLLTGGLAAAHSEFRWDGNLQYKPTVTDTTIKYTICQPGYVRDVRIDGDASIRAFFRLSGLGPADARLTGFNFYAPLQLGAIPGIDNLHPEWVNPEMSLENRDHREEVYDWLRKITCDDKISLTAARAVVDDYDLIHSGDLVFSGLENIQVYPPPFTTGRGYFDTHRFPGIIQFKRQKER